MRIGIEAQRIFRKNKHGMDYVVLEEIKQLQKLDRKDDFFIFVRPGEDRCLEDTRNIHIIEISTPSYPLWEQWALPRAARYMNVDILHCTSNTAPIFCGIPLILTLHDIIFLEPRDKDNKSLYQNLGWYYRKFVVPKVLKKCKRIITVSNFEYDNIQKKLNLGDRLRMIYNGYNEWFRPIEEENGVYKNYISERGYFLFLGNTDPKKNTARTIVAYAKYFKASSVKRKLLMADLDKEYLDNILQENDIEYIREYIVTPGYIANKDLPYLYNDAFAFLYTSLRESFGIPLLEAMACGTPVITSNTSSMPEIAGNNGILINPESVDEITLAMLKLEEDPMLYQNQKSYGIQRASMFSWRKTAEELLQVYEECYKTR